MFLHNLKYAVKSLVKGKDTLFWTFLFPLALFTFMYMAFEGLIEKDAFTDIPVAVVRDGGEDEALMSVLNALSADGENKRIDMEIMSEADALDALENETVTGVIYTKDASLVVNKSDTKQTILEMILNQYKQTEQVYLDVMKQDAKRAQEMAANLIQTDTAYYTEVSTSNGRQNEYYNYFYAVLAMSSLFASFAGITRIHKLQANTSALGMRRCLSPNPKMAAVFSEYLALLMVQFLVEVVTLIYMSLFGVEFGNKYPAILFALFVGCNIGIAIGMLIGSISRIKYGAKNWNCSRCQSDAVFSGGFDGGRNKG